ncbi:hypothetical protein AAF712_009340 [Marasmius tenuissimus]|uniref:Uncharacterized protein n=1 Tax=Marasmius tenuissimus TaxID=585030 RepID=A0ABR2ZSR3_9AGAR
MPASKGIKWKRQPGPRGRLRRQEGSKNAHEHPNEDIENASATKARAQGRARQGPRRKRGIQTSGNLPIPPSNPLTILFISEGKVEVSNADVCINNNAAVMIAAVGGNRWVMSAVGDDSWEHERHLVGAGVPDDIQPLRSYTIHNQSFVGAADGIQVLRETRRFKFDDETDYVGFKETLMKPKGEYLGFEDIGLENAAMTAAWRSLKIFFQSIVLAKAYKAIGFEVEY